MVMVHAVIILRLHGIMEQADGTIWMHQVGILQISISGLMVFAIGSTDQDIHTKPTKHTKIG